MLVNKKRKILLGSLGVLAVGVGAGLPIAAATQSPTKLKVLQIEKNTRQITTLEQKLEHCKKTFQKMMILHSKELSRISNILYSLIGKNEGIKNKLGPGIIKTPTIAEGVEELKIIAAKVEKRLLALEKLPSPISEYATFNRHELAKKGDITKLATHIQQVEKRLNEQLVGFLENLIGYTFEEFAKHKFTGGKSIITQIKTLEKLQQTQTKEIKLNNKIITKIQRYIKISIDLSIEKIWDFMEDLRKSSVGFTEHIHEIKREIIPKLEKRIKVLETELKKEIQKGTETKTYLIKKIQTLSETINDNVYRIKKLQLR